MDDSNQQWIYYPCTAVAQLTIKQKADGDFVSYKDKIPAELLFASGSGLDPHINVSTAYFQIERVAKSRGIESEDIKNLVDQMIIKSLLVF